MKKFLFLIFLFYSISSWATTVQLSSNEIQQGQSVELIISSDTLLPSIDFTPLTKNFMLAGQSSRQASQFINGVGTTTYEKSIVLFPVQEGKLTIPSLKIGSEQTPILTLNVLKKAPQKATSVSKEMDKESVSLDAKVNESNLYIGQNTFYTVTVENAEELSSAEIIPPSNAGIKLSPIGQDVLTRKYKHQTIKRRFLLKPEKSGEFNLSPALLNGEVYYQPQDQINAHGLFSLFNSTHLMNALSSGIRPIQIVSNPVKVTIKQKPNDWKGWWLPSSNVVLNLVPEIPQVLETGNTFYIDITLEAINVDSNDLPIPKFPNDPNFRYYPEPEERHTSIQSDGNIKSSVHVKYTIMPLKTGSLTLPQIIIPWFDVKSGTKKIAKSMPLSLNVRPGNAEDIIKPAEQPKILQIPSENQNVAKDKKLFWIGFILAFILGILISFGLFLRIKKNTHPKKKEKPIPDFYPF